MRDDIVSLIAEPQPLQETIDNITQDALTAWGDIKRYGEESIEHAVRFGGALNRAKKKLPRGGFGDWCKSKFGLKESQCAAYQRLYLAREDLPVIREWAQANGHRYANSFSADRLARMIDPWKVATGKKQASKRKIKSAVKVPVVTSESKASGQVDRSLPAHIVEAAENLATTIVDHNTAFGVDLLGSVIEFLAEAVRSRTSQSCGAPQLSGPTNPEMQAEEPPANGGDETPLQRLDGIMANQNSSRGKSPLDSSRNSSRGI
jgi:hypothetical protein